MPGLAFAAQQSEGVRPSPQRRRLVTQASAFRNKDRQCICFENDLDDLIDDYFEIFETVND